MTVSKSFYRIIVATLLIMHGLIAVNAQTSVLKDTISIIDTNITEVILYSSNDSIYNDLSERKVHLYGNAKVEMGDIKLTAGYIFN